MGIIIGIDPGIGGAVCLLKDGNQILELKPTPTIVMKKKRQYDVREMSEIIKTYAHLRPSVYIEQVAAMPKQGVTSMFSFGKGYGMWIGIVTAHGLPLTMVTPQEWKSELLSGTDKSKGASIQRVKQLFPDSNLKISERGKVDNDGLAEAVLIAKYGNLHSSGLKIDRSKKQVTDFGG